MQEIDFFYVTKAKNDEDGSVSRVSGEAATCGDGKSKIIIEMRISQKEVQAELFSEIVNGRSIKKTVILKNMLCG